MIQPPPPPRTTPPGSRPDAPAAPTMTNGATVHGRGGVPGLRHPREMVLVCVCTGLTVLAYGAWLCVLVRITATSSVSASSVYALLTGGLVGRLLLLLPAMPRPAPAMGQGGPLGSVPCPHPPTAPSPHPPVRPAPRPPRP